MILYLDSSSLVKIYIDVIFSSFDKRLVQAARAEGIPLLVPNKEILE